jgi:tetratricopeptide (TPR) repeat protein
MSPESTPFSSRLTDEELFRIALLDVQEGRHEEALGRLKRLIDKGHPTAAVYTLLAAEYAELGMLDHAQTGYEKAIELEPSLAIAHFQLGLTFYVRGSMELAKKQWAKLEALNPYPVTAYYANALICFNDRQLQAGLSYVRKALSLNPDPPLARDIRALESELLLAIDSQANSAPEQSKAGPMTRHALLAQYETEPDSPKKPRKPN